MGKRLGAKRRKAMLSKRERRKLKWAKMNSEKAGTEGKDEEENVDDDDEKEIKDCGKDGVSDQRKAQIAERHRQERKRKAALKQKKKKKRGLKKKKKKKKKKKS